MRDCISDGDLDNYYARDYYGPGTDYFDPPDWESDYWSPTIIRGKVYLEYVGEKEEE
jgi:hypothetical protein